MWHFEYTYTNCSGKMSTLRPWDGFLWGGCVFSVHGSLYLRKRAHADGLGFRM